MSRGISTLALVAIAAGLGTVAHAAGQGGSFAAQRAITPGRWTVQVRDGPTRHLCIADAVPLIQLAHPRSNCARLVIVDRPDAATIQYSCPGAGWGRTSIRVESSRRVQIDTQGIAQNEPYAYQAEAHRTGSCNGLAAAARPTLTKLRHVVKERQPSGQ